MQNVKVIEVSDPTDFEKMVNSFLNEGYKVSSTSCGFVNSEKYDFCGSYQAVLIKENND
jgi:hypothetical protein